MHWWWFFMGAVIAAGAVVAPKVRRRHRRRVQVDRVTEALSTWLPALNQPDSSIGEGEPPTSFSAENSTAGSAVRRRRTLMFGALYPDISVGSRRAA